MTARVHVMTVAVLMGLCGLARSGFTGSPDASIRVMLMLAVLLVVGALSAGPFLRLVANPARRYVVALASIVLLLLPLTPVGRRVNGSFIDVVVPVLGRTVQPSHLAVVVLLAVVGAHLTEQRPLQTDRHERGALAPVVAIVCSAAVVPVAAIDLGTAATLLVAFVATTAATARPAVVGVVAGTFVGSGAAAALGLPHARRRIGGFLDGNRFSSDALAFYHDASLVGAGPADDRFDIVTFGTSDWPLVAALSDRGWVFFVALFLATSAFAVVTTTRLRHLSGAAAGAGVGVLSVWMAGTAIAALTQTGSVPVSGVVWPFFSPGLSGLATWALAGGFLLGLPSAGHPLGRGAERARPVRSGVPAITLAVALTVSFATAVSGPRIVTQALTSHRIVDNQVRGTIHDRHGTPLARTEPASPGSPLRVLLHPAALPVVGVADRSGTTTGAEDLFGAHLRCGGASTVSRAAGRCRPADLTLTLDLSAQEAVADLAANTGSYVVLADLTGGLLAAADPTTPRPTVGSVDTVGLNADDPLLSPPVWGNRRPSGSTMKLLLAVTGIDLLPDESWAVADSIALDDGTVVGSPSGPCGGGWEEILAVSCNPAAAQAAVVLGDAIGVSATDLGIDPTIVPAPGREGWPLSAIGFSPAAMTPAELVLVALPVAAGGLTPGQLRIAGAAADPVRVVSQDGASRILAALATCRTCGPEVLAVGAAAKSGTAGVGDGRVGSCVGVWPAQEPRVVFAVQRNATSGAGACQVAADVLAVPSVAALVDTDATTPRE